MAATDKLQLVCPRCHTSLTLDCGFAGSVCRCSCCGELLSVRGSVPQDDQTSRPDSPPLANAKNPAAAPAFAAQFPSGAKTHLSRHRWPWVLLAILVLLALATAAAAWWALR